MYLGATANKLGFNGIALGNQNSLFISANKPKNTVAIGFQVGQYIQSCVESIFIGAYSAENIKNLGQGNVFLGAYTGQNIVQNANYNILIGYNAGQNIGQAGYGIENTQLTNDNIIIGNDNLITFRGGNCNISLGNNILTNTPIGVMDNYVFYGNNITTLQYNTNINNKLLANNSNQIYLGNNIEKILIGFTSPTDVYNGSCNLIIQGDVLVTGSILAQNFNSGGGAGGGVTTSNVDYGAYLIPNITNNADISQWFKNSTFYNKPIYKNILQYNIYSLTLDQKQYNPLQNTSNNYNGGILVNDGRIVLVPRSAKNIGIFNPSINIYSKITVNNIGNDAYSGGTLLPNGNVLFTPYSASNVGIFNPYTNTFTSNVATFGNNVFTDSAYKGSILLPSNDVLFVPYLNSNMSVYNTTQNITSNIGITLSGNAPYYDGCAMTPNGTVILVPSSSNIGILNTNVTPYIFTSISPAGFTISPQQFSGGVLLNDGRVLFVPNSSSNLGIFNPVSLSYTSNSIIDIIGSPPPSPPYFSGGVLLSDGRVVLVPYNSSNVGLFDPANNNIRSISDTVIGGSSNYTGGVLMQDGRVLLVPAYNSNMAIISGNNIKAPIEFCTHRFFNKF
jgi:hypothetical protein